MFPNRTGALIQIRPAKLNHLSQDNLMQAYSIAQKSMRKAFPKNQFLKSQLIMTATISLSQCPKIPTLETESGELRSQSNPV